MKQTSKTASKVLTEILAEISKLPRVEQQPVHCQLFIRSISNQNPLFNWANYESLYCCLCMPSFFSSVVGVRIGVRNCMWGQRSIASRKLSTVCRLLWTHSSFVVNWEAQLVNNRGLSLRGASASSSKLPSAELCLAGDEHVVTASLLPDSILGWQGVD